MDYTPVKEKKEVWSIHQPNFIPWLGFFDKIFRSDHFVVFDFVQISSGKGYDSRVRILLQGKEHWITMPIKRSGNYLQKTCEVEMVQPSFHWKKICKTIYAAYHKAPYIDELKEFLQSLVIDDFEHLAAMNTYIIEALTRRLGNDEVKFHLGSEQEELLHSSLLQTDLIVQTCQTYGMKNYLSGKGCLDFLEPNKFGDVGIDIRFQEFQHPVYDQLGTKEFMPGLSIIDPIANCGFDRVASFLKHDD